MKSLRKSLELLSKLIVFVENGHLLNKEGCKMGSVNEINCDNCSFSVNTSDNLTMMVCNDNLDYYDELYCLNCQKIVNVWQRKNGKDTVSNCPKCGSHDVFLEIPDKIKCPKCKKGNLKSKLLLLTD